MYICLWIEIIDLNYFKEYLFFPPIPHKKEGKRINIEDRLKKCIIIAIILKWVYYDLHQCTLYSYYFLPYN